MTLLEAKGLKKRFLKPSVLAVDGVSFRVEKGRTLGVVGESGSGKTTLARLVLGLLPADEGEVLFKGMAGAVFQGPFLSLDPRMRVRDILKEPYRVQKKGKETELDGRVEGLLRAVELPSGLASRYPRQLSGGECQRVAVARAVALEPALVVCDEPVSSLDVLVRLGILNLLLKLQKEKGMAYLFITHDLRVARHMSDEILVMKDGKVCEYGPRDQVFETPRHPYTQALVRGVRGV